jgi:hypothetical protein
MDDVSVTLRPSENPILRPSEKPRLRRNKYDPRYNPLFPHNVPIDYGGQQTNPVYTALAAIGRDVEIGTCFELFYRLNKNPDGRCARLFLNKLRPTVKISESLQTAIVDGYDTLSRYRNVNSLDRMNPDEKRIENIPLLMVRFLDANLIMNPSALGSVSIQDVTNLRANLAAACEGRTPNVSSGMIELADLLGRCELTLGDTTDETTSLLGVGDTADETTSFLGVGDTADETTSFPDVGDTADETTPFPDGGPPIPNITDSLLEYGIEKEYSTKTVDFLLCPSTSSQASQDSDESEGDISLETSSQASQDSDESEGDVFLQFDSKPAIQNTPLQQTERAQAAPQRLVVPPSDGIPEKRSPRKIHV